jgi:phage anti-repressor protein
MIPVIKSHDEDCVSAHALYKALKLTTPPYAQWVESWLPNTEEAHDYYEGDDVTPKRGTPYLEYFLSLKFAKELCEKRRKPEAAALATFLGEHLPPSIPTPLPVPDILEGNVSVVETTPPAKEPFIVEPETIVEIVLEAQRARAAFDKQENELKAQLAQLQADRAAFIEQTNNRLGLAA